MQPNGKSAVNREMLEGMEAYLDSLDGDPDIALEKLAGKNSPENIRRRMAVLINSNRIYEAASEARLHEKSKMWVDLATFSLAAIGADAEAGAFLDWAKAQPKLAYWHRSTIGYYDGTVRWAFRNRPIVEAIVPGTLSEDEYEQLERAAAIVRTTCTQALTVGRPEGELEVELLSRLLDASHLMGARETSREIAAVLEKRVPIPIRVAHAILQDIATPIPNAAERLWTEHGESFTPRFLSCAILGQEPNNQNAALEKAYQLINLTKSDADKERLCGLLFSLTNLDDSTAFSRVTEVTTALLGEDSRLLTLMLADDYLRKGDAATALSIVEPSDIASDPQAIRIAAMAKLKLGYPIEALSLLQGLANIAPSPWVFTMICDVAGKHDREDEEREALEHLLAFLPNKLDARRRLSFLYGRNGEFDRAIRHLEFLRLQVPNDVEVAVNLAVSYSFDAQHERALAVLDEATTGVPTPLPIATTRAQILQAQGRSLDAFNALDAIRGNYWENPQFLSAYMTAGHAAARESEAHEALTHLLDLKKQGIVDDQMIREVSFDDLREMLSGAAKRAEMLTRYVIEGKVPWLLRAGMEREAIYWSWTLRTQSIPWLADHAIARASYSIYSTNGFRVFHSSNADPILSQIECAPKGARIVADASALITLHSLGLLGKAAEYFDGVLIPASYLPRIIADLSKLFPHQLSQKKSAEQIKAAVDRRAISIWGTETTDRQVELVDEYADSNETSVPLYRLIDLLDSLHERGLLSDPQRDAATSVAHEAPASTKKLSPLQLGSAIRIGEGTLVTLAGIGCLDVVTENFAVHISHEDFNEITSRIRAFQALDRSQREHKRLWESIQSNPRFTFVPVSKDLAITDGEDNDRDISTAAYRVAIERNLPLLVDDRVCQTMLLNERKEEPIAAFGTDALLLDMANGGALTYDEAADAYLKLIAWRYRFISVPPEILKRLANRYRSHPPGSDLRKVAVYVHDCMRDEGLFAGLEPTAPPVSIAVRLYQTWIQNIADFIMDTWIDETVQESFAEEITDWAISEFLPSPPRTVDDRLQSTIASLTPRTAITRALIRSTKSHNLERSNRALQRMCLAFGLDDTEYLKIVAGVVNEI